ANPGKYSYASSGLGTTPHLTGELFKLTQELDLIHVPFNGSAPAVGSALAGHTPIAFTVLTPAVPLVKAGQLRALAVTTPNRSPALLDVARLGEADLADEESDTMQGVLVPAGTPKPIIDLLQREVVKAMAVPDVKERLNTLGFEVVGSTPDEFAARIKTEIPKWGKVIRAAKLSIQEGLLASSAPMGTTFRMVSNLEVECIDGKLSGEKYRTHRCGRRCSGSDLHAC